MGKVHGVAAMNGTLVEIMPFIDAGLLPFSQCGTCAALNPANVTHGPLGTVLVTCGVCRSVCSSTALRFFSASEARVLGWGFEEIAGERVH